MKQLLLQTGCEPFLGGQLPAFNGSYNGTLLGAIIRGCAHLNNSSMPVYVDIIEDKKIHKESESGAVLYIIAVLVFYSAGIVTMIIKYLKREKRELEEERTLEDFFRSMPAYKKEREQYNVNKVAIHAFHALTSLSYDDVDDDNVTSDDEETFHVLAPTIHEHHEHHTDFESCLVPDKEVETSAEITDAMINTDANIEKTDAMIEAAQGDLNTDSAF